jgi:purine-cytosine permease-like protein
MRLFLVILLVLLPTILYLGYLTLRRRATGGADWWESGPGFWAALAGVVLLIGVLISWALTSGAPPDSRYVPEGFRDGELVEGHFERDPPEERALERPDEPAPR